MAADEAAYAKALAAGKADPGEKATTKADEEIRQAERLVAALTRAATQAEGQVEQAVKGAREEIVASLTARLTDADRAYDTAVDAWEAAAQDRTAVLSALLWVEEGDPSRRTRRVGGWLPGLRARQRNTGQDAASFGEVAQAMREVTTPVEAPSDGPGVAGSAAAFFGAEPANGA